MVIKNKVFLSFDISTTCIGLSIFDIDFNLLDVRAIKLKVNKDIKKELDPILVKADFFKQYLDTLNPEYEIVNVFIEEPLLSSNNVFTVNKLLRFNGICSWILKEKYNLYPILMSVHDVRVILNPEMCTFNSKKNEYTLNFRKRGVDPKEYIFNKIHKHYGDKLIVTRNRNNKINTENYDITDSIALAYSCFKKYYNKKLF